MANNTAVRPLFIDTAITVANAIFPKGLYVSRFEWDQEGSVAGENIVVQDQRGVVKWQDTADSTNYHNGVDFNPPIFCDGLAVPTHNGGVLLVYTTLING